MAEKKTKTKRKTARAKKTRRYGTRYAADGDTLKGTLLGLAIVIAFVAVIAGIIWLCGGLGGEGESGSGGSVETPAAVSDVKVHFIDVGNADCALIECADGANTLNGITFSAKDTEEASAESLKKAVADAKAKAEILAEAAGLKITGIETISEGGVFSYDNNVSNFSARGTMTKEEAADGGTLVQAAKMIVSASVTVTFTAE